MSVKEVIPGVYQFNTLWSGVWGANVFLLVDDKLTLVDTGFKGRAPRLFKEMKRLGFSPSDITNIILIHHHLDHTGCLHIFKRASQARVIAHPDDAPYIEGQLPQPIPATLRWLTKPLRTFWSGVPVKVDMLIRDGDELPIFGGIKVLHTPGHTPGSISLFLPHKRLLIAGDMISHRLRLAPPPKAFTVDMKQAIESVKRVASLDFDVICFGHGAAITDNAHAKIVKLAGKIEANF